MVEEGEILPEVSHSYLLWKKIYVAFQILACNIYECKTWMKDMLVIRFIDYFNRLFYSRTSYLETLDSSCVIRRIHSHIKFAGRWFCQRQWQSAAKITISDKKSFLCIRQHTRSDSVCHKPIVHVKNMQYHGTFIVKRCWHFCKYCQKVWRKLRSSYVVSRLLTSHSDRVFFPLRVALSEEFYYHLMPTKALGVDFLD